LPTMTPFSPRNPSERSLDVLLGEETQEKRWSTLAKWRRREKTLQHHLFLHQGKTEGGKLLSSSKKKRSHQVPEKGDYPHLLLLRKKKKRPGIGRRKRGLVQPFRLSRGSPPPPTHPAREKKEGRYRYWAGKEKVGIPPSLEAWAYITQKKKPKNGHGARQHVRGRKGTSLDAALSSTCCGERKMPDRRFSRTFSGGKSGPRL